MADFLESLGERMVGTFGGRKNAKGATRATPGGSAPSFRREEPTITPASLPKRLPRIRIAKNTYRKNAFKKVASLFSYLVILTAVIYMCFAITILRVLPTNTSLGFVPVKNITFPGGIASPGDQLVMNTKKAQGSEITDQLQQAFLMNTDVVLVEVVAGPYGKVNWTPTGITTVDGKPMPVKLAEKPKKEYLENDYLVKCIRGACAPGEGMIVPMKNVYGSPVKLGG